MTSVCVSISWFLLDPLTKPDVPDRERKERYRHGDEDKILHIQTSIGGLLPTFIGVERA
jgi:hypothetical protein